MTATVAAAMLGWILIRNLRLRLAIPITAVLAVTAILTGYARIWFGAHWFTDVVGGALFGLAIVALSINLSAVTYDAILRYRSTQTASSPR